MSLKKIYNITVGIMVVLLLITIFLLWDFTSLLNESQALNNDGKELIVLSNDMLHVNDYLVKLMKIYIITNDATILDEYLSILENYESLEGKLDKMEVIGLSGSESDKVSELLDILDKLAEIENIALEALDNDDKETAVSIIYGDEYADIDNLLAQVTQDLISDITSRVSTTSSDIQRQINLKIIFIIIYLTVSIMIFITLQFIERGRILKPISQIQHITDNISKGNIDLKLTKYHNDEIGVLIDRFNIMIDSIKEQCVILDKMANGDYTNDIYIRSADDVINNAINQLVESTTVLVSDIRSSAEQVSIGASQIASTTQMLSANAEKERDCCIAATKFMQESLNYTAQMVDAMQEIANSYEDIKKIVKIIDNIALQTNILALNSGIEAAKAGEAGKSFSVIADEIRELASNSTEAAKKTGQLIEDGAKRVEIGNDFVEKVNKMLELIIKEINLVSSTVGATAAKCQESAVSTEEMASQANVLIEIISKFTLDLKS